MRKQSMRKQSMTSQKTQPLSPTIKRRLSYMQELQQFRLEQLIPETQQPKSIQTMIEHNLSEIKTHNNRIIDIIYQLQNLVENQVMMHEESILCVVKKQIRRMLADCEEVMEKLVQMLEAKVNTDEIGELRNEVQFFRSQAKFYYTDNNRLKQENKILSSKLIQKSNITQQLNEALKNITKKYLKQKMKNKNIENSNAKRNGMNSTNFLQFNKKIMKNYTQQTIQQEQYHKKQVRPKTMGTGTRRLKQKKINTQKIEQPEQLESFYQSHFDKFNLKMNPGSGSRKYQSQARCNSNSTKISNSHGKMNTQINNSTRANTFTLINSKLADESHWIYK